jgi:hypothetical protein
MVPKVLNLAIKKSESETMCCLTLILLIIVSAPVFSTPKIGYEWRTASGKGRTEEQAKNHALLNAVEQVNGSKVNGKTAVLEKFERKQGKTSTVSSSSSEGSFERNGIVRSYQILESRFEAAEKLWKVSLRAEIINVRPNVGKKSIAVLGFVPTKVGTDYFADQLTKSVQSNLTSSRKFLIVESRLDNRTQKYIKSISKNPLLSSFDGLMMENGLPPELIFRGEIHHVAISLENAFPSGNIELLVPSATLQLTYQVLEPTTAQVKLQKNIVLSFNSSDYSQLKSNVEKQNIDFLTAELSARSITKTILDAIYPVLITSISEDNQVTLNFGKDFLNVGEKYEIYQRSNAINDPYVQENISWDQNLVGEVLVTRTLPKMSFGLISTNEKELHKKFQNKKFVAYLKKEASESNSAIKEKSKNLATDIESEF